MARKSLEFLRKKAIFIHCPSGSKVDISKDVFHTARANGFKIQTLDSACCKVNYFGLVLIE